MHIKYGVNLLLYVNAYRKMFLRHKDPTALRFIGLVFYEFNLFIGLDFS